jgi:COP9 signalosome complex subunit 2
MSDDEEYEYDYGSDAEDEEDEMEGDDNENLIEIENSFYEAEDLKNENPVQAAELFTKVVQLESQNDGEIKYRFKSLQYLVTINYKLGKLQDMLMRYKDMLAIMSQVTPNERTEAINAILDVLANMSTGGTIVSEMYEITLGSLKGANNERLWFQTNQKLAQTYIASANYDDAERVISEMKASCQLVNGRDDPSKGTYLLEVYNLEIQMCSATNDNARMREVYPKTLSLNAAVSDPRVMGIIREEGGKMYMSDSNWTDGLQELSEAFRAHQEAGNPRAKTCLKYVILASMLALSDINPLAAPEAKVFNDDKEILAMSELRQSLEANDLPRFERILQNKQNRIVDEPFLMKYIDPLRRRMREQVLANLVKPYKRVKMSFLMEELHVDENEVESMLVSMILDDKLPGARIDQLNSLVILGADRESLEQTKLRGLRKWAFEIESVSEGLSARVINQHSRSDSGTVMGIDLGNTDVSMIF